MKHFFILWSVLVAVVAAPFSYAAEGDSHPIRDGLIKVGTGILKNEGRKFAEKRQEKAKRKADAEAAATQAVADAVVDALNGSEEQKRTWGDRGKDMLGVLVNTEGTLPEIIKATLDVVLDEYREQFKEEGRQYAKEIGDTLAERATSNEKISSTLTSVKALCWGVVVYLTLVTIYLVFTVRRLRSENAKLQELVEASLQKKP